MYRDWLPLDVRVPDLLINRWIQGGEHTLGTHQTPVHICTAHIDLKQDTNSLEFVE